MNQRYRIVVDTWPLGDYFTHKATVYNEAGLVEDMQLGTTADEALEKARRWVAAQSQPATRLHEVWVDERGRDAAAPEAHSKRAK